MPNPRPRCQARTGGHLNGRFVPKGRCGWYARWLVQERYGVCKVHLRLWRLWFGLSERDYRRLGRRAALTDVEGGTP